MGLCGGLTSAPAAGQNPTGPTSGNNLRIPSGYMNTAWNGGQWPVYGTNIAPHRYTPRVHVFIKSIP